MQYNYIIKTSGYSINVEVERLTTYYAGVINDLNEYRNLVSRYDDLKSVDLEGLNEIEKEIYLNSGFRERHDQISDLVLFIVLIDIDIEICCKNLLINRVLGNRYEMNYFSRALAIHCADVLKPQSEQLCP